MPSRSPILRRVAQLAVFWYQVKKTAGCWYWTGNNDRGYGIAYCPPESRAHRVSWMIHFGPIPKGKWVKRRNWRHVA